jgi:alpha-glucosidase
MPQPLYRSWGIKGVKFGFVNVGSQKWTSWLHDAVRKAAKHELLVDVHDEYRPTGYSRTYPNLLTQEGVRGDESLPSTEQALTTLFTRSLAGASDFTICYFDARVSAHWSHSHQLAKGVCFYSPWQFVFWYDTPLAEHKKSKQHNVILDTPELDFFRQMPTVWDETKVLAGEIGEYAVVARRSGDRWFVGALNNREPRTLQIPLSFLEADRRYEATIYRDDPAVDTPTQVGISRSQVDAQTTLAIQLGRNGGQAMIIEPAGQPSAAANATRRD